MSHFESTRRKLEGEFGRPIEDTAWAKVLKETRADTDPDVMAEDVEDTARTWLEFQVLNSPTLEPNIPKTRQKINRKPRVSRTGGRYMKSVRRQDEIYSLVTACKALNEIDGIPQCGFWENVSLHWEAFKGERKSPDTVRRAYQRAQKLDWGKYYQKQLKAVLRICYKRLMQREQEHIRDCGLIAELYEAARLATQGVEGHVSFYKHAREVIRQLK